MHESILALCLGPLGAQASTVMPPAADVRSQHALAVTARGPSAAQPLHARAGAQLELEVDVRCASAFQVHGPVEVRALYAAPNGDPEPISGTCGTAPFAAALPRDREVVVALHSTFNELRVFDLTAGGQFVLQHSINLPTRIEAIDIDDADNDGKTDIVVGLAGATTPNQLRIFRYDAGTDSFHQELISATLPLHIEDVEIGDADNDGENEIVIALERISSSSPTNVARVLLYEFVNGAWSGPVEVSPPEPFSAQDVAIGDANNDGANEIAALFANVASSDAAMRQVRIYEHAAGQWVREDVTPAVTSGLTRAERLIIADADGVAGNEIFTAYWGGSGPYSGELVALRFDGADWNEEVIDSTIGIIDSLDAGDFDGDAWVDLAAGTGVLASARIRYYEHVGGSWVRNDVSNSFPGDIIWDVDIDDPDSDHCSELLGAVESTLLLYEPGSPAPAGSIGFSVDIDSAQVGDVDHDGSDASARWDFGDAGGLARPFRLDVSRNAPEGVTWSVIFEARARVRTPSGELRDVRARSSPIAVRTTR